MLTTEASPVSAEYLEYYTSQMSLDMYVSPGRNTAQVRSEVKGIWNLVRPSDDGIMAGLRGMLFLTEIPQTEAESMKFSWEFREHPLTVMYLLLSLYYDYDSQTLRTCPENYHERDLSLVLDIPDPERAARIPSDYKRILLSHIGEGIFGEPEIRYRFQDIYRMSRGVPPLFILGHGGGYPKTVSDKKSELTAEYIDSVMRAVSPAEFSAVVDCSCNGDNYLPQPGAVPYIGVYGRLGEFVNSPSFIVMPDGSYYGSYIVQL